MPSCSKSFVSLRGKILQNALPTNVKRVTCHLAQKASCPRFSVDSETIFHVLRDFLHSREIWLCIGVAYQPIMNYYHLNNWIYKVLYHEEVET